MILIDSLHIKSGGGLILLNYLIDKFQEQNIHFYLLLDKDNPTDYNTVIHKTVLDPGFRARRQFYERNLNTFSKVLCFANIPAPVKLPVPVYTYFHNINLMTLGVPTLRFKTRYFLIRLYLRLIKKNTSKWIVQTTNTAEELKTHLCVSSENVLVIPFYNISSITNQGIYCRRDYAFVGEYTGSKGHDELLEAWNILHDDGSDFCLHITCTQTASFLAKIKLYQDKGVRICNHGSLPHDKVGELLSKCKAMVYPSHNESLGLGIVEAIEAGCDIISSDLPFTYSICVPSEVFNPCVPDSIAKAVKRYENSNSVKSTLIIKDDIQMLIDLFREE